MPAELVVKFEATTAQSRPGHSRPPRLRLLTHMPNRGRCEFVYLWAGLYITNSRSDRDNAGSERWGAVPGARVRVRRASSSVRCWPAKR